MNCLSIDIGGTWIKGIVVNSREISAVKEKPFTITKVRSRLSENSTIYDLVNTLKELTGKLNVPASEIGSIGISVPGIVNYHGSRVLKAASHINVLKNESWKEYFEKKWQCNISLINDADAAAIGLAELGYLKGNNTIGIMPVGTGLGFAVWRNGRRWRPGKSLTLLGSIRTPEIMYDTLASASKLAEKDIVQNLLDVLSLPEYSQERNRYIQNLTAVINTAGILYTLDEVIICGGLADAAEASGLPLAAELTKQLADVPPELDKPVNVKVATEGNRLQLIGAMSLAAGEAVAADKRVRYHYSTLETEIPYRKELALHDMSSAAIINTLWKAEEEAGDGLSGSLDVVAAIADRAVHHLAEGGRIIYVGCGTSGRIAAMDAVEISCTYGLEEEKAIAVVAGGIADAAIEIESGFEEDASSVPDMLLLNIHPHDVVIGISASGSAYYVQSALALAKERGALTAMIQANLPATPLPFCEQVIPLFSGNEVVAGSTRMKAGTATKKILNFLSTAIMIRLGKVTGPYMTDVACINDKLVKRAQAILHQLYELDEASALRVLGENQMRLKKAIEAINK